MIKCQKEFHLLTEEDAAPYSLINESQEQSPVLLVCDHASHYVPKNLNSLEIEAHYFERHIGYDIGAAQMTHKISENINASAVLAGFSRLVIDANRFLIAHDSMPIISDGVVITGNESLGHMDRLLRIEELFIPYHDAINRAIARQCQLFSLPIIFSIHSCTPVFKGFERPWEIGVVWEGDNTVAILLIDYLLENTSYDIGDNQPYHACDPLGYTMRTHAESKGYPHVMIEVRQDLVIDEAGQKQFADILSDAFEHIRFALKDKVFKL